MWEKVYRVWSAMHGAPQDWMVRMFCVRGVFRDWVTDHEKDDVELRPYGQNPQLRDAFWSACGATASTGRSAGTAPSGRTSSMRPRLLRLRVLS